MGSVIVNWMNDALLFISDKKKYGFRVPYLKKKGTVKDHFVLSVRMSR